MYKKARYSTYIICNIRSNGTVSYVIMADPSRFRFAHQTSFVRRHSGWSRMPGIRWIVSFIHCSGSARRRKQYQNDICNCLLQVAFFRQFFASVTKVDYMTMRHGFINVGDKVLHVP